MTTSVTNNSPAGSKIALFRSLFQGREEAGEASGLVGLQDLNCCGTSGNCDPDIRASDVPSVKSRRRNSLTFGQTGKTSILSKNWRVRQDLNL